MKYYWWDPKDFARCRKTLNIHTKVKSGNSYAGKASCVRDVHIVEALKVRCGPDLNTKRNDRHCRRRTAPLHVGVLTLIMYRDRLHIRVRFRCNFASGDRKPTKKGLRYFVEKAY